MFLWPCLAQAGGALQGVLTAVQVSCVGTCVLGQPAGGTGWPSHRAEGVPAERPGHFSALCCASK